MSTPPGTPPVAAPKGAHPGAWRAALALLAPGSAGPDEVAAALLRLAEGEGSRLRAVAAALEVAPPPVREALARRSGWEGPWEAIPSARTLLRRARGQEEGAHARSNPIARNDPFTCVACGLGVEPTRRGSPRSHCPRCLASLHVDVVPGDRAADCGGVMDVVSFEVRGGGEISLVHRCRLCAFERRARALVDADPQPDDIAPLLRWAGGGGAGP